MDCYKCDKCGSIFDEFEMDFKFAQEEGVTLCRKCKEEYQCRVEEREIRQKRAENFALSCPCSVIDESEENELDELNRIRQDIKNISNSEIMNVGNSGRTMT